MTREEIEALYTTEDQHKEVDLDSFIEKYLDPVRINGYCRTCPRYCKVWSCPEHEFDPVQYWKVFQSLELWCRKISLDPALTERTWTPEEQVEIIDILFFGERKKFDVLLRGMETENSISLNAGHCDVCGRDNCSRKDGLPCRFPKLKRYSIESLGGDVTMITSEIFGLPLDWVGGGRLPKYFMLVGGILTRASQ